MNAIEHETGAAPTHSIIWLHGLGADGNDFAPIVPELVAPHWPALRFVFPNAPVQPVTINGGMAMRAWYDITGTDLASRQDVTGMHRSVAQIEALIARENERGVPSERIFVVGFSQGGAIALASGLSHAKTLAGVVALSTYLPQYLTQPDARHPANANTPIFWAHGTADPVVLLKWGAESRAALEAMGYRVDWHDYPMAHSVSAEEVADLRDWLGKRLG